MGVSCGCCRSDPEPVDATALQVGPGDEENYSDDNESSAEEHEAGFVGPG